MNLTRLTQCRVQHERFLYAERSRYSKWTEPALYCYEIGCNCSKCIIGKNLESECDMKIAVMILVEKYGRPFDRKNNVI